MLISLCAVTNSLYAVLLFVILTEPRCKKRIPLERIFFRKNLTFRTNGQESEFSPHLGLKI